jgi:hypothetical protein
VPDNPASASEVNVALRVPLVARVNVRRSLIGAPAEELSTSAIDCDRGRGSVSPEIVTLMEADSGVVVIVAFGMSVVSTMFSVGEMGSMNEIENALAEPTQAKVSATTANGRSIRGLIFIASSSSPGEHHNSRDGIWTAFPMPG